MSAPDPRIRKFGRTISVVIENHAFTHGGKVCFSCAEDVEVFDGKWTVVLCGDKRGGSWVVVFYNQTVS